MNRLFPTLRKPSGPEPFHPKAEDWDDIVRWLYEHRPMHVKAGVPPVNYPHAWKTKVTWDSPSKSWVASVRPGFVRGVSSEVYAPETLLHRHTFDRLGFGPDYKPKPDVFRWARLSDFPKLPIKPDSWRVAAAGDSVKIAGNEDARPVPAILVEKYNIIVPKTVKLDTSNPSGLVIDESEQTKQNKETARQLRSVELILAIPRPVIEPVLTSDPTLNGVDILSPQISYPVQTPPQLRVYRDIPAQANGVGEEAKTVLDALGSESALEELRQIATVWMMGPPGDMETETPDQNWTPIVQYQTWFNLDHVTNSSLRDLPPFRLVNPAIFLAGGENAQVIIDGINAANAETEVRLSNAKIEGAWWTV